MNKWTSGKILGVYLLVLVILPGLSACGGDGDSLSERMHEKRATKNTQKTAPDIKQHWAGQDTRPVSGFAGEPFYVLSRSKTLEKYPCKNCHTESFDVRKSTDVPDRAHWEIEVDHGSTGHSENFECATCHDPSNPDELRVPAGDTVSMDASYELCGSCHQKKLSDWAGGAHGKRYDYWQGARVIYNCADCHDPHDPAVKKRWPVTYPSVPRKIKGRTDD